jgi:hypothetical protein
MITMAAKEILIIFPWERPLPKGHKRRDEYAAVLWSRLKPLLQGVVRGDWSRSFD